MIIFIANGLFANHMFQYSFLKTIAVDNELIIATNMYRFTRRCDYPKSNFKHFELGKQTMRVAIYIVKPLLTLLSRVRLIGSIEQNKEKNKYMLGYRETKGLFPIKIVERDYFQSESFFNPNVVDFTLKQEYLTEAREFLLKIPKDFTKVFVHIRRGDYQKESYMGVTGIDLPKKYFERAIKEIERDIQNPFYIFLSDDPGCAEEWFANIKNKIVSRNSMGTDLAIMTMCDAGITSNSTFSWWGAYLIPNRKKIVYPKYWYGWKHKVESHIGIQPSWGVIIDPTD